MELFDLFVLFLSLEIISTAPNGRSSIDLKEFIDFLEQTRNVDSNHYNSARARNPLVNPETLSGKFEGDIDLDDDLMKKLIATYSGTTRNALLDPNKRWPNNTVVYDIHLDNFSKEELRAINASIEDIETNTCIKFRKRDVETDEYFVNITGLETGCHSHVGYSAAEHPNKTHNINLSPKGCMSHGTITHEIMHTLGLYHMQSTHNRDDYVKIIEENIVPAQKHNFLKYGQDEVSNLGLPYDYGSVMHYPPGAFSVNGKDTIVPIKSYEGEIGQRVGPSKMDWMRINRLYECDGAWDIAILHKIT